MRANVGYADRSVRMTLGIMMSALGLSGTVDGVLGVAMVVAGALLVATGAAGRCFLYRALGWTTFHDEAEAAPSR